MTRTEDEETDYNRERSRLALDGAVALATSMLRELHAKANRPESDTSALNAATFYMAGFIARRATAFAYLVERGFALEGLALARSIWEAGIDLGYIASLSRAERGEMARLYFAGVKHRVPGRSIRSSAPSDVPEEAWTELWERLERERQDWPAAALKPGNHWTGNPTRQVRDKAIEHLVTVYRDDDEDWIRRSEETVLKIGHAFTHVDPGVVMFLPDDEGWRGFVEPQFDPSIIFATLHGCTAVHFAMLGMAIFCGAENRRRLHEILNSPPPEVET